MSGTQSKPGAGIPVVVRGHRATGRPSVDDDAPSGMVRWTNTISTLGTWPCPRTMLVGTDIMAVPAIRGTVATDYAKHQVTTMLSGGR